MGQKQVPPTHLAERAVAPDGKPIEPSEARKDLDRAICLRAATVTLPQQLTSRAKPLASSETPPTRSRFAHVPHSRYDLGRHKARELVAIVELHHVPPPIYLSHNTNYG